MASDPGEIGRDCAHACVEFGPITSTTYTGDIHEYQDIHIPDLDFLYVEVEQFISLVYAALSEAEGMVWSAHTGVHHASGGAVDLSTLRNHYTDLKHLAVLMYDEAVRRGVLGRVNYKIITGQDGRLAFQFATTKDFLAALFKPGADHVAAYAVTHGLSIDDLKKGGRGAFVISAVIVGVLNTGHFIFSEEYDLGDYIVDMTWDLGVAAVSTAGGILVGGAVIFACALIGITAPAWVIVGLVFAAGVGISIVAHNLNEAYGIKDWLREQYNGVTDFSAWREGLGRAEYQRALERAHGCGTLGQCYNLGF